MVEEDIKLKTGAEKFLRSSDELLGRAAAYMDSFNFDEDGIAQLSVLRDVCDVVKITAMSIKALKEDEAAKKTESPMEKLKRKAQGSQVSV